MDGAAAAAVGEGEAAKALGSGAEEGAGEGDETPHMSSLKKTPEAKKDE